jgi:CRISPR/Cas system-associated protein Cas10 (large subunit of type III CRISPR-Cas system)
MAVSHYRKPGQAEILPTRYDRHMEKAGERYCDLCGRPIPKQAKLATREDGKDICLACQIRDAQVTKGLRH